MCRSDLSDKFLNAHAELLVSQQQYLNDEETDLSIVAFNTAQRLHTCGNTHACDLSHIQTLPTTTTPLIASTAAAAVLLITLPPLLLLVLLISIIIIQVKVKVKKLQRPYWPLINRK